MTFDERKRLAREMIITFMETYSPPRGLSEDALAGKLSEIADAFARKMPTTGDYVEKVEAVFARVRDTHMSNTWPTQAAFVAAMPFDGSRKFMTPESYSPDDELEAAAKLMNAGEPVSDLFVVGQRAGLLLGRGLVSRDVMDAYRTSLRKSFQKTYGKDADAVFAAKYGGAA